MSLKSIGYRNFKADCKVEFLKTSVGGDALELIQN